MSSNLTDLTSEQKTLLARKILQKKKELNVSTEITTWKDNNTGFYPVSYAQKRFFFLDKFLEDKSVYNTNLCFQIKGIPDIDILQQSFDMIIERHKILGMVFKEVDGEPLLTLHENKSVKINFVKNKKSIFNNDDFIHRVIDDEIHKPFDLEKDVPIRILLLQKKKDEFILLIVMHHIACDAWSYRVLFNELKIIYDSIINKTKPELPELKIQYYDFAFWQENRLNSGNIVNLENYWKKKLQDATHILNLITDKPRPNIQTYAGNTYEFRLSQELFEGIKHISENYKITHFVIVYSAFAVLLYRYTMQDDILIGIPIAGRTKPDVQNLIGLHINTLVLRTDLTGNPSVEQVFERVKEVILEGFANEEMPFERLVDILKVKRTLSHSPLFQILFNYHEMPELSLELADYETKSLKQVKDIAKLDIEISFRLKDGYLTGYINYNTDLFTLETMKRMSDVYCRTLESIIEDPSLKISKINILPEKELKELDLLSAGNLNYEKQNKFIYEMFEEQAGKTPNTVALVCGKKRYTYKELNEKANQLAAYLVKNGAKPESKIIILLERSANYVIAMLAVIKAQAAYIPLDTMFPVNRIQYIIEDACSPILITEPSLIDNFKLLDNVKKIDIVNDWIEISKENKKNLELERNIHDLMYIIYTSGTTGLPKGVAVENINYSIYLPNVLERLGITKRMSQAIVSTFAADLGSTIIWGSLVSGGELHVIPYELSIDPDGYSDYIFKNKIDVIKIVPSHLEMLFSAENPEKIFPVKLLILAGEASTWDLITKVKNINPKLRIINSYGPTETTVSATLYDVDSQRQVQYTSNVPIGKPFNAVATYVLDNNFQKVPKGVPGELFIGGPLITRGYFNRDELTESKFIRNPFSDKDEKIYRTGDLVRYLEDGNIEFLGRIDDQVKIKGYRIELGEIAGFICKYPDIQDAVVNVCIDKNDDKHIVAYIVLKEESKNNFDLDGLKNFLKSNIAHYMLPHYYMLLDDIPLNANGKVARDKLPEITFDENTSGEYVEPRNDTDRLLVDIYKKILSAEKIGIKDDFFYLGGDSFKAFKVVSLLNKKFPGVRVIDIFMYPAIQDLSDFLESIQGVSRGRIINMSPQKDKEKIKYNLLCIPYAAGSPVIFSNMAAESSEDVMVYSFEYPGAYEENNKPSIKELAKITAEEIKEKIHGPIIVYGHCMGGPLSVEIARNLENMGIDVVKVIIGAVFPFTRLPGKIFEIWMKLFPNGRNRSDRDLLDMMLVAGGLNDDLDEESKQFMITNMRHYSTEVEKYFAECFKEQNFKKLNASILSIAGEMDRLTRFYEERYLDWAYFSDEVDLKVINEAGHFFHIYQTKELYDIIISAADEEIENRKEVKEKKSVHDRTDKKSVNSWGLNDETKKHLKNFFIVIFGQFISLMGSQMSSFAIGIWVYQKTGSMLSFAIVLFFSRLPEILMLPIAGAIADKWDRRKLMIVSNILAFSGSAFLFIVFLSNAIDLWHVYLFTAITAVASALHRPAYLTSIAQLIPKKYLGNANGLVQLSNAASNIVAPVLGGFLILVIKINGILIIDLISFLFAFVTLMIIKFPARMVMELEESIIKSIIGGFNFIIKRKSLVIMVVFFFVANIFLGIGTALTVPLVLSFSNTKVLGLVVSFTSLGSIIGGFVMMLWGGFNRRADGMIGFNILMGISYIVMSLYPNPVFPIVGGFLYGLSLVLINTHWQSLIQVKVGVELQGRVFSINELFARISVPFGIFLGGLLSEKVFEPFMMSGNNIAHTVNNIIGNGPGRGIAILLIFAGIVRALLGVIGMKIKSYRYMEDILPDIKQSPIILKDKDKLQELADMEVASS